MLSVEAVVTKYLKNVDIKGSEIHACCPFHEDFVRSFSMNRDTGKWICFAGCGGGGLEQFLDRSMSNPLEAGLLAAKVDVVADTFDNDLCLVPRTNEFLPAYNTQDVYIKSRGFTDDTIKSWGVGTNWETNSVIIPVRDDRGVLVGYTQRQVFNNVRYLHRGYPKSLVLFGLYRADLTRPLIITEGILDCMWLHQNGYENSVAILGTKLSYTQENLLKGLQLHCKGVILGLDNDDVGRGAAMGINSRLPKPSKIIFPTKKDWQDMSKREIDKCLKEALWIKD